MKTHLHIFFQSIYVFIIAILLSVLYTACDSISSANLVHTNIEKSINTKKIIPADADAATILKRPQVPILCYHQIRSWSSSDSKTAKDYIVPVNNFNEQIKWLADNSYHTISPDQLYDYLLRDKALPTNPVMITFDDSREEQYAIANEEMKKYGFKAVYFIMTVALNKPGYMTKQEVKQLADEENTIGSHTWNHSNLKKYSGQDWSIQVDKPSMELEKITGRKIEYFAYPFGLWNKEAIEQLKQRNLKAAFQLSERRDENDPLFTIRRMIVPGEWNAATLQKWMKHNF